MNLPQDTGRTDQVAVDSGRSNHATSESYLPKAQAPEEHRIESRHINVEYQALNKARDRRKRRMERNLKTMMNGGYKQVPVLLCNS